MADPAASAERVVFAGGGTGGHIYPAVAVAQEIARRRRGLEVVFMGTGSAFEKRVVEGHGFRLMSVRSRGFLGKSAVAKVSALFWIGTGLLQSIRILWGLKPRVVVGVGGFASAPAVGAAILLRIPTMIQEQNLSPGLANRILARWVDRIAVSFEETKEHLGGRGEVTGNPIRAEFSHVKPKARGTTLALLVFGGSQGARAINERMLEALPHLAHLRLGLRIVHMTGEKDRERAEAAYQENRLDAQVVSYLDKMAEELARADLVICRAGATTVSELTACQKAAILIPFPEAAADHQRQNAEKLHQAGAAVVLQESELDGERLAREIGALISNPERITAMERAAGRLAFPDAAARVADLVEELMSMKKIRQVHFVGIGGIGMSGIAEVLLNLGYGVTGSDLVASPVTRRLEGLGGKVAIGHAERNVIGADVVVISSAVNAANVEVAEARRLLIPVIPRAEMLAELMRMKYGVAIAGSHGKTSTTSMVAQVLSGSNLDPTIVIGGRLEILGSNAKLGKGDLLVAEADESDGSFLHLSPTIAVVTNIDAEHLDHYGSLEKLKDAFVDFLNKVPFYGTGIVCADDPRIREILPRLGRKIVTYGLSDGADLKADRIEVKEFTSRFEVAWKGKPLGKVELRVPGRHSISNSLAAIGVGRELDLPFDWIASHLREFRGADRRFQLKGETGGILVIDDYGHHPAEIEATLEAARKGWDRRTVVVFQPHRYSRARALREEFARCFRHADVLVVTDIYPAGETPIPGVTAEDLAEAIRLQGHRDVTLVPDLQDVPDFLISRVRPGDMVITMGAGSVWKAGDEFLRRLGKGK